MNEKILKSYGDSEEVISSEDEDNNWIDFDWDDNQLFEENMIIECEQVFETFKPLVLKLKRIKTDSNDKQFDELMAQKTSNDSESYNLFVEHNYSLEENFNFYEKTIH